MNIDPQPDDIGRHVLYYQRGTGAIEEGSIVSFNDVYVFVRFESPTPKGMSSPRSGMVAHIKISEPPMSGWNEIIQNMVDAGECPTCGLGWWLFPPARCDELKPDGTFGPGPDIRCVGCKDIFHRPIETQS
jgi:hypothetical protein